MSPTVEALYGGVLRAYFVGAGCAEKAFLTVPTGEVNKTRSTADRIIDHARTVGLSRSGLVVGIGGGVLLDLVGFAASQFRRGVAHVKVGSTLVAQVDAAVGAKCGVNFGQSKNLVGAFHPPTLSIVDGQFLSSVAMREIRCGLAEMLKMGIACDRFLFDRLRRDGSVFFDSGSRDGAEARALVDHAVRAMVAELEPNLFEGDLRRRVDFGHTVSPLLESRTGYTLRHGEAVAIDMALFVAVSVVLGTLSEDHYREILDAFFTLKLPIWHEALESQAFLESALGHAEAQRGRWLNQPIPIAPGVSTFLAGREGLTPELLQVAVRRLRSEVGSG